METNPKNTQLKKRDNRLQSIYSRCLLTKKVVLPINFIGKNLDDIIENYIRNNYEGKCIVQGFVKPNSSKIIRYSSGIIERGNNIVFEVVFECDVCYPSVGMLISCSVKNVVKAGVRAEVANEFPSPVVIFVAKDHHFNVQQFNEIKVGDIITISVVGVRFELNDKYVSVVGKFIKEKKDYSYKSKQPSKPRLVFQD